MCTRAWCAAPLQLPPPEYESTQPSNQPLPLPTSLYHPDPLATGSVEHSATTCVVCGQARGYVYTGPGYADRICPWCIADGAAHARLNVAFTDTEGIGGYGVWSSVPAHVVEAVAHRTLRF